MGMVNSYIQDMIASSPFVVEDGEDGSSLGNFRGIFRCNCRENPRGQFLGNYREYNRGYFCGNPNMQAGPFDKSQGPWATKFDRKTAGGLEVTHLTDDEAAIVLALRESRKDGTDEA